MDELIRINFNSERPTVSGRDLHAALEVKTAYKDWFPRMCDYGFEEGTDFCSFLSESTGGRPAVDHQLFIAMAKELCMIQRSETGRKFRQYFIKIEEAWNSPEAVMARALQFANNHLSLVKKQNLELLETVAVQNQQIVELKPKATYYDIVLNCRDAVNISVIAKDYGWSAQRMNEHLHKFSLSSLIFGFCIRNMQIVDTPKQTLMYMRIVVVISTRKCIQSGHRKADCLSMRH